MSGPIVRTGPTPSFSKNWENVFGKKKAAGPAKSSAKKAGTKAAKKSAKKAKKGKKK